MTDKKQGDTYQSDIIFMNENDPFQIKHRKRTSKKQLEVLEKTFETCIRPDAKLRKKLGDQLGMTPRAVQIWFQNRRAKVKKAQGTVSKRKTEPREDYYSKEEDSTPSPCTYRYPKRYPKKIYSEDTTGSSNYSVVEGSQVKNNYKFDNENYKEFDNEYLNTNNTGNTTDTMEVYKEN
ncbi:Homeobox protein HD-10, partial [Nosema granulosis]